MARAVIFIVNLKNRKFSNGREGESEQSRNDVRRPLHSGQIDLNARKLSMPLYEYELCEGTCAACGGRFTLRRPVTALELKACPACKKPVRKIISSFNSPQKL